MANKILLIDDDEIIVALTQRWLTKANIDHTCVTSPITALSLLRKEDYSLIISDLSMPKVSGVRFLKYVKRKFAIPCVAITALRKNEVNLGDIPVYFKPLSEELFLRIIRENGTTESQIKED